MPRFKSHRAFAIILIFTICVFGGLRFYNLSQKFYWEDEVLSSMRIFGQWTKDLDDIFDQLQDHILTTNEIKSPLLRSSSTTPRGILTIEEDYEHTPLYFFAQYFWIYLWGDSISTSRLLSALIGVFSIGAMFIFSRTLFQNSLIGLTAACILALSFNLFATKS